MGQTKKNVQVESLRAITILMIVFYHYCFRFGELYGIAYKAPFMQRWGTIGVGMFFILSGFYFIPEDGSHFKLIPFYVKRIIRLYPAYFIGVITTFIVVSLFKLPGREISIFEFLLNLIMVNGYFGIKYVDGAHWYLTYLFSAIFIIGLVIKSKIYKKPLFYIFWLTIGFVSEYFVILNILPTNLLTEFQILTCGGYAPYIIIGITLKKIFLNIGNYSMNLVIIVLSCTELLFLKDIWILLAAAVSIVILLAVVKEKLLFLNWKPLVRLGSISYILYLLHQNIGYCILLLLGQVFQAYHQWYVLITVSIIVAFSFFLNKYLVVPFQNVFEKISFKWFRWE